MGSHSCLDVEDLDTDHYTGTPTLGNYEVLNLMSSSFIQMKKISDGFGYMIYCRIPGTTSQSWLVIAETFESSCGFGKFSNLMIAPSKDKSSKFLSAIWIYAVLDWSDLP